MKKILYLILFSLATAVACQYTENRTLPTRAPTAVVVVATGNPVPVLPEMAPTPALPATMTPVMATAVGDTLVATAVVSEQATNVTSTVAPTQSEMFVDTALARGGAVEMNLVTATATYWPTVTRQILSEQVAAGLVPCAQRTVDGGLLILVTQQFALPEYYVPADLVPLGDYFDDNVTRGQTLFVREAIVGPLQQMVGEMQSAGLQPSILSAYRSYGEQALAWHWWSNQYPGRVAIMSARPGQSEHQLGTTVDFGSPEIDHLFHVDFADTAEGVWLANNAHRFGFTLSFPQTAYAITGFKYEPWHFRYVGMELATELYASGAILTQWQLANQSAPCIP